MSNRIILLKQYNFASLTCCRICCRQTCRPSPDYGDVVFKQYEASHDKIFIFTYIMTTCSKPKDLGRADVLDIIRLFKIELWIFLSLPLPYFSCKQII